MGLLSSGISYLDKQKQTSTADINCCTFSVSDDNSRHYFSLPFKNIHNLLNSHGISQIGLFVPFNGTYHLVVNHGFDFDTTLQSKSSENFWLGAIGEKPEENTWYQQSGTSLDSFLQLFSLKDRDAISMLHLKFCNIGKAQNCIIIATQPNTQELVTDHILSSIDDNWQILEDAFQPTVNRFVEALSIEEMDRLIDDKDELIERCLSDDLKGNMYSIYLNRFIDELIISNTKADSYIMTMFLFAELKKALDDTSICTRMPDNSIKLIAFSHFDLNLNIFKEKLFFYLKPYFEENSLVKMQIVPSGSTNDTETLYRFISSSEN